MATTKATTLAHTLGGISSDISTAEINRLDGVTGDLQTQLDAKAPTASPTFTGTITAPNDSISGDVISGGTIGAGTFNGALSTSTTGGGVMAVGTVSESSGTPTGDIIQKGSNSNGEYIRYADGTQICWITAILSNGTSDVTWNFPVSFKTSSLNNIFGVANDANRIVSLTTNNSTTVTSVNFRAWGLTTSGYPFRSGAYCMLCAIGRWF